MTKPIKTIIDFPAGAISLTDTKHILRLVFESYKWFSPTRYGYGNLDKAITTTTDTSYDAVLAYFQRLGAVCVAAKSDRDYILLSASKPGDPEQAGQFVWVTSSKFALNHSWRTTHAQQITELMRLFGSPVARSATHEDIQQKMNHLVERGGYQEEVVTVRDYSEGLAGLFWRNFYGPPFVRLFGERLNALPPECVTRLGEELALVQPYELPTEAGTEAARAREQHLISLLGPECFYDHEHHRPPTRRPVLPSPPWPPPGT